MESLRVVCVGGGPHFAKFCFRHIRSKDTGATTVGPGGPLCV